MAKGVEDTAFYRYGRLLALNDVGGDPGRFGIDVERLPRRGTLERAQRFPLRAAHDADARRQALGRRARPDRARCPGCAERVARARRAVARADRAAAPRRRAGPPSSGTSSTRRSSGAWPIEPERLEAYMEKALREAKRNTSWIEQNASGSRRSSASAARWLCDQPAVPGRLRAVRAPRGGARQTGSRSARRSLKLTAPGVPDIYQGDELAVPRARRPRQPPPGRLGLLPGDAARRLMGGAPPDRRDRQAVPDLRLLALRARRPEPFAGAATSRSTPARTCARSCAAARCWSLVASVRAGSGAGRRWPAAGRWRDVLTRRGALVRVAGAAAAGAGRSRRLAVLERV